MGKVSTAIFGAIVGGLAATAALVAFLDWRTKGTGQVTHIDPTRADYVDLLLSLVTILLAAVGLAVTVGALVIGLVALKTLREIKDEAAETARDVATRKITQKMESDLAPNVETVLMDRGVGYHILSEMARKGDLDRVMERVAMRMQSGGPEANEDEGR